MRPAFLKLIFCLSILFLTLTMLPTKVGAQTPITCTADINSDSIVDLSDYSILVNNFLKSPIPNSKADITHDGIVDLSDYSILVSQFLKPCIVTNPTSTSTVTPTRTPTPTPITSVNSTFFSIGTGPTEVIPHQITRAANDRVYIITSQGGASNGSPVIKAFWSNPGLPNSATDFTGNTTVSDAQNIISVESAYDGANTIHTIVNTMGRTIKTYPFSTATNTFKSPLTLATDGGNSSPESGTAGVSAAIDTTGKLHLAYWSSTNHIIYKVFTYNATNNTITLVEGPMQLDTDGSANHPALAVSPVDNSVTVAWVSESATPKRILARTKTSSWSAVQTVSTAPVWVSTNFGINIDQGPTVLITQDNLRHLIYMQDWENVNGGSDYGRIHYATSTGSNWTDTALSSFSHDPVLAITSTGNFYIIGHGHPKSTPASCPSMDVMCVIKRNSNGTWGSQQVFATPPSGQSFDTSPSVKWSTVGWNRPEIAEFIFSRTPYDNPPLYYARIGIP